MIGRGFLSIALAIGLTATPLQAKEPPDPNGDAVTAAMALMLQGRTAQATAAVDAPLAAYEALYKDEKRTIYCADDMATTLAYMLQAAAAKRSAVAIRGSWCNALFIKGYGLIESGRVADGIVYLERALSMAPSSAHYLNELGYAYQALRDWDKALAAYRRVEAGAVFSTENRRIAERTRALRGIGYVLVEQGKWDEADAAYRASLDLDPKDAKAAGERRYIADHRPKTS